MKSLLLATLIFTGCGIEAVMCREDAFCFECRFTSDGGLVIEQDEQVAKTANGDVWIEDAGEAPDVDRRLIGIKNAEASCYFYKCSKECGR
jgi:hypothetical protein